MLILNKVRCSPTTLHLGLIHRTNVTGMEELIQEILQCVTHDSPNDILKEEVKYFRNMFSFQSPPSPLTEVNCMDFSLLIM